MNDAVAQLLGPMLGAILGDKFDVNPLLLEETEFDSRRSYEIRGRVNVRDHESIYGHYFLTALFTRSALITEPPQVCRRLAVFSKVAKNSLSRAT